MKKIIIINGDDDDKILIMKLNLAYAIGDKIMMTNLRTTNLKELVNERLYK
jgi:hypothetical protein